MNIQSQKIKVCHFADHLAGKADGTFAHILMIVKSTNSELYTHYLVCNENEIIQKKFTEAGGKIIISKGINKKLPIRTIIAFARLCKKENISIVHTHYLKPYIISALLKVFYPYKVIYNYHGLFIRNEYYNSFETKFYQLMHWIVCKANLVNLAVAPSRKGLEILLEETKIFPKTEFYYNCAVALNKRTKCNANCPPVIQDLKKENIMIGIIARISPEKRIDIALNILKLLLTKHQNIHFVFCGDGILLERMKKYSVEIGVEKYSTFLGFVDEVQWSLELFDIILFTSDREGFPLTIWEAMAAAVPIVTTDIGGIKEIVEEEACGILFEKGNIEQGADCLFKLIDNEQLRKNLGQNGKNAVATKYNSSVFGKRMEDIYQSVLVND
jgi:L-malate glycosyltransferase